MRNYGLLGKKLHHTFSPQYFKEKFNKENIHDVAYRTIEMDNIEEVDGLFNQGIDGFNVTIPYKEAIIPFLDEIDETALEIGAVNCVKRIGGKYKGFNTDAFGFKYSLLNFVSANYIKQALILGNGGAAKAVKFVLNELAIPYLIVTRNGDFTYDMVTKDVLDQHNLIVNTTPIGMFPNVESTPDIPMHHLDKQHFLYDLIYNPEKTKFLELGEINGALIKNGYEMLILQAENSWQIWNQI